MIVWVLIVTAYFSFQDPLSTEVHIASQRACDTALESVLNSALPGMILRAECVRRHTT